jgi:hypothetical protein
MMVAAVPVQQQSRRVVSSEVRILALSASDGETATEVVFVQRNPTHDYCMLLLLHPSYGLPLRQTIRPRPLPHLLGPRFHHAGDAAVVEGCLSYDSERLELLPLPHKNSRLDGKKSTEVYL